MAVTFGTNIYVKDSGHDDNGGGHDPTYGGNASLANQDSAVAVIDDVTISGSVASGSPSYFVTDAPGRGADWKGLTLNIISGSGSAVVGHHTISDWDSENDRFVLAASAGDGDVTSGRVGGRKKTVGGAGAAHVGGNAIWNIGETFMASGSNNVAGGRLTLANAASNRPSALRGCASSPDDGGYGQVTYNGSDTAQYMLTGSNNGWFDRLTVSTGSLASVGGIENTNSNNYTTRCRIIDHVSAARYGISGHGCYFNHLTIPATANNTRCLTSNGPLVGNTVLCGATGSAAKICVPSAAPLCAFNQVVCNSGQIGIEAFSCFLVAHNTIHGGGRLAFSGAGTFPRWVVNNVVGGIGTNHRAFDFSPSYLLEIFMHSNATYGLTGSATAYDAAKVTPTNQLSLAESPFVDAASLDFRLASNASAQLLKQAGWQEFVRLSDVIGGTPDIGALQALVSGGIARGRVVNAGA